MPTSQPTGSFPPVPGKTPPALRTGRFASQGPPGEGINRTDSRDAAVPPDLTNPYRQYPPAHQPPGSFPPGGYQPPGYGPPSNQYGYPPGYGPPPPYGYHPLQQQHSQDSRDKPAEKPGPKPMEPPKMVAPRQIAPISKAIKTPTPYMQAVDYAQTEDVDPMRTDFHFFVDDIKDRLLDEARGVIQRALPAEEPDPFLVNSYLNERLIGQWESYPTSLRQTYLAKEEEDRLRFISEDEVASRHCATLTARARSPKTVDKNLKPTSSPEKPKSIKSDDDEQKKDDTSQPIAEETTKTDENAQQDASPPGDTESSNKPEESETDKNETNKRPASSENHGAEEENPHNSPNKKNRTENGGGADEKEEEDPLKNSLEKVSTEQV